MPTTFTAALRGQTPPYVYLAVLQDEQGEPYTSLSIERLGGRGAGVEIFATEAPDWLEAYDDREAPFGVELTYRLTGTRAGGGTETLTTGPVTVVAPGCWLSDQASGLVARVEVASWPDRTRASRQSVLTVLGRPDPVVISDVHTWPAGTITFLTRDQTSLDMLIRILTGSGMVLLRTQASSSLMTVYAAVGDIAETRISGDGSDWRRLIEVGWQEITPLPAAVRPAGATLQRLHDTFPDPATLAEINAAFRSLLDIPLGLS